MGSRKKLKRLNSTLGFPNAVKRIINTLTDRADDPHRCYKNPGAFQSLSSGIFLRPVVIEILRQSGDGGKDLHPEFSAVNFYIIILFEHYDQFQDIDGIQSKISSNELGIFIDILRCH